MAIKLAGGTLGPEILDAGESIHDGLNRMAEDAIAFSLACLDNGADGIFFLAMHAHAGINRAAYSEFGVPYDQAVLEAVRSRAWGVVAHFHGVQPYFDLANRYPLDAISWEDRETSPSLREALSVGQEYVGTEHILLGLVQENEGVAARILLDFDVDVERIRTEVIRMLGGPGRSHRVIRGPVVVSIPCPACGRSLEQLQVTHQAGDTFTTERSGAADCRHCDARFDLSYRIEWKPA